MRESREPTRVNILFSPCVVCVQKVYNKQYISLFNRGPILGPVVCCPHKRTQVYARLVDSDGPLNS